MGFYMKILILGGTGIISTSMAELTDGHEVLLFNRSGAVPQNAGENIRAIACDRKDPQQLARLAREEGPYDSVIDMFCFLPGEAYEAVKAFEGITNQYIFCSTCDVYTKTTGRFPITEDFPKEPSEQFPYAYNKARCEELLMKAHDNCRLNVTIIRPAATYSNVSVLPLVSTVDAGTFLLDRLLKGKPFISHNDGLSVWSECHALDVSRCFINACVNKASYGQAYHTTGEEWMTWDEVIRTVCAVIGAPKPDIVHIPSGFINSFDEEYGSWCLQNFRYNNIFDNEKARRDLDFRYTITWEQGFCEYYENLIKKGQPLEAWDSHPKYDRLIDAWRQA